MSDIETKRKRSFDLSNFLYIEDQRTGLIPQLEKIESKRTLLIPEIIKIEAEQILLIPEIIKTEVRQTLLIIKIIKISKENFAYSKNYRILLFFVGPKQKPPM